MGRSDSIEAQPVAAPAKGGFAETVRFLLILFAAALLLRSFIVAPFSIPSGSMLPQLMIGDYLFVAKWPYGYSQVSFPFGLGPSDGRILGGAPERGDVVVFRHPGGEDDYVKRVIGLPGDTVQMANGALVLNGRRVPQLRIADYLMPISLNSPCRTVDPAAARTVPGDEPGERFCAYPRYRVTLPGGRSFAVIDQLDGPADDTAPLTVPAGHYFVMGDNRDDSEDSRYPVVLGGVGLLPEERLIGRALNVFFSTDGSADLVNPLSWIAAARWDRIGKAF